MAESKTILNNTYEVYSDGKIFSLIKKKYIKPIIVIKLDIVFIDLLLLCLFQTQMKSLK